MNGEKRMEEDLKQRKKNLIMFPLGTIGRDMVYNLVTSYLLTYVLFTRALTAAQLAAISAIMVGARVFDALNDPIMGNIIERTRTRWGKFKPWLGSASSQRRWSCTCSSIRSFRAGASCGSSA